MQEERAHVASKLSAVQNRQLGSPGDPPQYPIESVDNALKLILLLGEEHELRLTDAGALLGDGAQRKSSELLIEVPQVAG